MKTMEQEFNEKYDTVYEENISLKKQLDESKIQIAELQATIDILLGGTL